MLEMSAAFISSSGFMNKKQKNTKMIRLRANPSEAMFERNVK